MRKLLMALLLLPLWGEAQEGRATVDFFAKWVVSREADAQQKVQNISAMTSSANGGILNIACHNHTVILELYTLNNPNQTQGSIKVQAQIDMLAPLEQTWHYKGKGVLTLTDPAPFLMQLNDKQALQLTVHFIDIQHQQTFSLMGFSEAFAQVKQACHVE